MAIKTLSELRNIDGFKVVQLHTEEPYLAEADEFIFVDHHENNLIVGIGDDSARVDTLISISKYMLTEINKKSSCAEHRDAIYHLGAALRCLKARRLG